MNNELKGVGGIARQAIIDRSVKDQAIIERSVKDIESSISANNNNVKLVIDQDFDSNEIYIIADKYTNILVNSNTGSIRLPENPEYDAYYVNMRGESYINIHHWNDSVFSWGRE